MHRGGADGFILTRTFNNKRELLLDLVDAGSCQREGHVYIVVNGERSRSFGRCNLWIAVKGRD